MSIIKLIWIRKIIHNSSSFVHIIQNREYYYEQKSLFSLMKIIHVDEDYSHWWRLFLIKNIISIEIYLYWRLFSLIKLVMNIIFFEVCLHWRLFSLIKFIMNNLFTIKDIIMNRFIHNKKKIIENREYYMERWRLFLLMKLIMNNLLYS